MKKAYLFLWFSKFWENVSILLNLQIQWILLEMDSFWRTSRRLRCPQFSRSSNMRKPLLLGKSPSARAVSLDYANPWYLLKFSYLICVQLAACVAFRAFCDRSSSWHFPFTRDWWLASVSRYLIKWFDKFSRFARLNFGW